MMGTFLLRFCGEKSLLAPSFELPTQIFFDLQPYILDKDLAIFKGPHGPAQITNL